MIEAFDPEAFRSLGHQVVDALADHWKGAAAGDPPVQRWMEPEDAFAFWEERLKSGVDPRTLITTILERSFHVAHPRNLGHQVGPVLPAVAAIDLIGNLLDIGNGVYEVGQPATPMERVVLQRLASVLGLPQSADGVLTSGGSLGNLTALLAMRQARGGAWESGGHEYAVLVSEESHYCVDRAARIMGWGQEGVIRVPVDAAYRMSMPALRNALTRTRASGRHILGVVASAGSTATGQMDPLEDIANFCASEDLWLHVDAAHGGAFAFSQKARPLLRGIERADSVVVDFHKMLLCPSLVTAVLFRRAEHSYQSFAQEAGYLWRADDEHAWWDAAKRTLECTRPMLGLRAYALLALGGESLLETYIDRCRARTLRFAEMIEAAPDFELLIVPESNIICYRHVPDRNASPEEVDHLNQAIREHLVREGYFYIVQVEKAGRTYLRSAFMNPFTEEFHLAELLESLRRTGQTLKRNSTTSPS